MAYDEARLAQLRQKSVRDLRVVIVDYEQPMSRTLKEILVSWGVTNFRVYKSNRDALSEIVCGAKPDLALLNWRAGQEGAAQFARVVRRPDCFPYPFLPIIAFLTTSTREDVIAARDAGIDEFITIPFTAKKLKERVEAIRFDRRGFVEVPTYFGPDRRRGALARYLGAERRSQSTLLDPETGERYTTHARPGGQRDDPRVYL